MNGTQTIEIPVSEFDVELLPQAARQPGTDTFHQAVSAFIESEFQGFAGWVQIVVDDENIRVAWRPKPEAPTPLEEAVRRLETGDRSRGIQMLRFILAQQPRNAMVHYNLGMALSDLGKLDEAEAHLREAVAIDPGSTNARVALGVALARKKEFNKAVEVLDVVVQQDRKNPYALRNLAACLLRLNRDLPQAEQYMRDAVGVLPNDQQSWIGLAEVLAAQNKLGEAAKAYDRVIEINPASELAEIAKRATSSLAEKSFRDQVPAGLRPDAVMYCLAALQKFEKMSPAEIRKIGFEIATLGTKGINPNDASARYKLQAIPGDFSGLELLCYMFAAFKRIEPSADIGFDVRKEYDAALSLHVKKPS